MNERRSVIIAAALALTAGFADGTGYLRWHLFAANMTGNVVLLGIAALHADAGTIGRILVPIGSFLLGCAAATVVRDRAGTRAALGLECALLATAALLHRAPFELVTIAFAMGAQNTALSTFGGVRANTSFITGDLNTAAVAVVHLIERRLRSGEARTIAVMRAIVGCYTAGAASAAASDRVAHGEPLWLTVAVVAAVAFAVSPEPAHEGA